MPINFETVASNSAIDKNYCTLSGAVYDKLLYVEVR